MPRLKVFAYIVRHRPPTPELLVFSSLDEPGYEVPKGAVETSESLEQAVHREVLEETGIEAVRVVQEIGTTRWQGEEQHFFLLHAPVGLLDRFDHQVTGADPDAGFCYRYRWLPLTETLDHLLVQGCNAFVAELLQYRLPV